VRDPQQIIDQARAGAAEPGWRVFGKKRNAVGAFFRGTSGDPDPILVITPESAVEYVSRKHPVHAVFFAQVAQARLRAKATTTSDSMIAHLHLWIDLTMSDGSTVKWQTASFRNDVRVMQGFIEGYAVHSAWRR
jgi:hypothetical protein